jgi:thiamine biosynthesis lipoprotein
MSVVASPILCRRPAMNTWFEIILLGDDDENLQAAGEAALDEIERVEKLLSRFDTTSEVSRINRDAAQNPVLVDWEMAEILQRCSSAWMQTSGFFDITANCKNDSNFGDVEFNFDARLIAFRKSTVRLDFGAFGKGYALDRAANCLRETGVKKALLHGGTSSVLAIGSGMDHEPWRVGLRKFSNENDAPQIRLCGNGLSTSGAGEGVSNILNPHSSTPIEVRATCSVVAQNATQAEIFSTALLCMGRERAAAFISENKFSSLQIFWTDDENSSKTICL